jgi:nitronate monooxygenase
MNRDKTALFLKHSGAEIPVICGAMYPCSNAELVGAASSAGAIGIVQPLSLIFADKRDFREGLKFIRGLARGKPFGMNVLTEQSSKIYMDRMKKWVDIALEEGCRFFISALGNPAWIVKAVSPLGGIVYHDVTERKWAEKALEAGVSGLICVNNRAGGHAGKLAPQVLYQELQSFGVPLIMAGGVGNPQGLVSALQQGYAGVQMGTRFIASKECTAHEDYKRAIVNAHEKDIVLTDKISGVPVSVIRTPYIEKIGTHAGPLARWMLRHPRLKHWMRLYYSLTSFGKLKKASLTGAGYKDFWQAGKSVDSIDSIRPVADIVSDFATAWRAL